MSAKREYSEYLAFRRFLDRKPAMRWAKRPVHNEQEVLDSIKETVVRDSDIFLSGGIDSAILARFLKPKTKAYTIVFDRHEEELEMASNFAKENKLRHKVIRVRLHHYHRYIGPVTGFKKAPLHPTEIALYIAAKKSRKSTITVGIGADSNFGGLDKLLSRDWTLEEFIDRYTFVRPELVLKEPVDVYHVYEQYLNDGLIDTPRFLEDIHGPGIIETFHTAARLARKNISAPYEMMHYAEPLDFERIRNGESKYVLRNIYKDLYPGLEIPDKNPFSRPMDEWMKKYRPGSSVYKKFDIDQFNGEQRWLLYSLEKYVDTQEKGI